MKTNSQQSFLFRFKIQFKAVSTSYTVQVVPIDLQQYMLNSNTSTTAVQTNILGYLMHLRNPDQRSQTGGVHMSPYSHSVVNQQSQHQVPLCLQCHDGSYFSLSQHSSTYTARQTTMLQASISRLPVSATIRQAPLFLHTTEPQVFHYTRIISQMWQLNQGH